MHHGKELLLSFSDCVRLTILKDILWLKKNINYFHVVHLQHFHKTIHSVANHRLRCKVGRKSFIVP